jgi:hypothetical protein
MFVAWKSMKGGPKTPHVWIKSRADVGEKLFDHPRFLSQIHWLHLSQLCQARSLKSVICHVRIGQQAHLYFQVDLMPKIPWAYAPQSIEPLLSPFIVTKVMEKNPIRKNKILSSHQQWLTYERLHIKDGLSILHSKANKETTLCKANVP